MMARQVMLEKFNKTKNGNLALKTRIENKRREKIQHELVNGKSERALERKRAELARLSKLTSELRDEPAAPWRLLVRCGV